MHGDEAHAGLDEPTRHQRRLAEEAAAVVIAKPSRLLTDVERAASLLRRRQRQGTLLKTIVIACPLIREELAALGLELLQERTPSVDAIELQFR